MKLIPVKTRFLLFYSKRLATSFKFALKTPDSKPLRQAEASLAQEAQKDLEDSLTKGDFRRLNVLWDDHRIIAVEGCVEKLAGMARRLYLLRLCRE